ncbi:MAG: hypothetical protein D6737_17955 [Chloroflexi bacterium]|nr:MAG: hypothetical protein D6737_17955 [Chloroflexota bacterium]
MVATKIFSMIDKSPHCVTMFLIAQEQPQVECFSRHKQNEWVLKEASGLDQTILLPSIEYDPSLDKVYAQISLNDDDSDA